MKVEQFTEIVSNRISKCKEILVDRAEQYATAQDRLHNFKRGASIADCTPAQYAKSLMLKQFTSVLDIIDGTIDPLDDIIDEKMTDIHNYLYLIEALLKEQRKG